MHVPARREQYMRDYCVLRLWVLGAALATATHPSEAAATDLEAKDGMEFEEARKEFNHLKFHNLVADHREVAVIAVNCD